MLLPRGEVILENTKVRFVDFDTLLSDAFESTLKKREKINGYLGISYHDRKDVLIMYLGQIKHAIQFVPNKKREIVPIQTVLDHTKEDFEGIVNYYRMPLSFLEMMWHSTSGRPLAGRLSTRFIRWKEFTLHLAATQFDGFLEVELRGSLGYYLYNQGKLTEQYWYQEPDMTGPADIRVFEKPIPVFLPERETLKLSFVDIFKDMFKTTFSIIAQDDNAQAIISRTLNESRKKHSGLLQGVNPKKSGLLDFELLFDNLETIPPNQKRDGLIDCFIDILNQRLLAISEIFGPDMLDRTLKELKLVQIYHQPVLRQFGIGESLLALWKKFD